MRIISIDPSSHIGWAILEDDQLVNYGVQDVLCYDKTWPFGIHQWARDIAAQIFKLIENNTADLVLIERANSSKFRNSQNILDWMHFDLISILVDEGYKDKLLYVDVSHWRKVCNLKLNAQQKIQNKMASQANKAGTILKVNGKRKGKLTKKHLAVNWANDKYGLSLKLKDNDIADAICLGASYFIEHK